MKVRNLILGSCCVVCAPIASAATFMDAEWAKGMCDVWNNTPELVNELGGEDWSANNADRGYKIIRVYREKCGPDGAVQLTISDQDGKAMCTHGGTPTDEELNTDVDYLMHATDEHWQCMGEGSFGCGAMGAMMSGKLQFSGPKMEAMGVMGPFNAFLKSVDEVPGDMSACP